MDLAPEQKLHGFTVRTREELPEIDGTAYVLDHDKSGAQLLYLRNDDNNKAFSIAFKTPPADDTGVFHILEHSVLCGSDKFPVKEPFVDLLKSSMQTFLNAMTFPDKTMYPVASTNDQDLLNLADVYLDAVLHPAIYRKRAIFEQEGWHYELGGDTEAEAGDSVAGDAVAATEAADGSARLVLNGVVYNEMKGALSDPNSRRAARRAPSPTSPTSSSWRSTAATTAWTTATSRCTAISTWTACWPSSTNATCPPSPTSRRPRRASAPRARLSAPTSCASRRPYARWA